MPEPFGCCAFRWSQFTKNWISSLNSKPHRGFFEPRCVAAKKDTGDVAHLNAYSVQLIPDYLLSFASLPLCYGIFHSLNKNILS